MTNAVNLASAAGTGFAFRNRIINGDMTIDQRNNGASVTTGVGQNFAVDRMPVWTAVAAKLSVQRQTGGGPSGFDNYMRITTSTAYTPSGTQQYHLFEHAVEGFNTADLQWGTTNAKTVTASFWVRSSKTGSFAIAIRNESLTRSYITSYTISTANTWEYKTVTFPGDTTGTWSKTNGRGLTLDFDMGSSSDYSSTTTNSWFSSATQAYSFSGAQTIITTQGATWDITGLQLEVGSVATPFERRPYGLELALCQRYYQTYPNTITYRATPFSSSFAVRQTGMLCVPMRAAPSVTVTTSGIGNQNTTTTVIGTFNTHVQFEAVTPNSSAWGNPHYDVAYNASAEL